MKKWKHWLQTQSSFLLTSLVFLLTLCITFGAVAVAESIYQRSEKNKAQLIVLSQAGKIQHVIETLLFTTKTVGALLEQGNGEITDFDAVMKKIFLNYDIRNVSLAPNGIVSKTYPTEGNEASLGHDLLHDPARATEAELAKNSKELTLAGPYTLKQGGFGAIGRLPIYLKDASGVSNFWGFVCVTIEFPKALKDAQMETLEDYGFSYELWKTDPDNGNKIIISKSDSELKSPPQECEITLPNTLWTLSAAPSNGWLNMPLFLLKLGVALSFSSLTAVLYKCILEVIRNRNELNLTVRQQAKNYRQLNLLDEQLRSYRHDMKNHLFSISSLLNKDKIIDAQKYIHTISDGLTSTHKFVNTENYVLDALISEKSSIAKEKNIQVETDIRLSKQLNISNLHCSALFGNILDNAIEACQIVRDVTPKIQIFMQYRGNILHVRISNTTTKKSFPTVSFLKTSKKDAKNHGFGMKTICYVVNRYKGTVETSCENGVFTISFLLFDI